MPIGILFWVLYVLAVVIGIWGSYEPTQPLWYRRFSGYIVLWILVGILGWSVFGPVVK
jgi:hypothetical protein